MHGNTSARDEEARKGLPLRCGDYVYRYCILLQNSKCCVLFRVLVVPTKFLISGFYGAGYLAD